MLFLEARAILSNGLSIEEVSGLTGPQQWEELRTFYSALERMELATVNLVNKVELAPMEQLLKSRDRKNALEVLDQLTNLIFSEDKREYVRNLLDALSLIVDIENMAVGGDDVLSPSQEFSAGGEKNSATTDPEVLLMYQTDCVGDLDEQKGHRKAVAKMDETKPPRPSIRNSLSPKSSWTGSLHDLAPHVVNIVATEAATFYDVFGVLGIPMIITFVVSAAWTFVMAAIQIHADSIANTIMNTTEFDNGEFWLLPKPEKSIVVSSVVLLTIFGIGYTALAVTMMFFYRAGAPKKNLKLDDILENTTTEVANTNGDEGNFAQRIFVWVRELPADIREHYFVSTLTYLL
ncbi:hypothetical protein PInf_007860 [Phytophthora infestans]|nr:hypothetical protein PInf_007860 [Phytophthora infestans]